MGFLEGFSTELREALNVGFCMVFSVASNEKSSSGFNEESSVGFNKNIK